jgi:hypothetical protein
MTALAQNADRRIAGGDFAPLPVQASANPFQGSLLSLPATGYAHELVAGEPFAGICTEQIATANVASADGDRTVNAITGEFLFEMALTGVSQDDVAHRRSVYASDDNTLTFNPAGNTYVGVVVGVSATNVAIIAGKSNRACGQLAQRGTRTLAATGNITLTTADLDKVILLPSTGAQAITLPASADCAGRSITFKKTTADAVAATITPASGTIDGAANHAAIDAANDTITAFCDGTNWYITAQKIA